MAKIEKDTFDEEIGICQKASAEHGGECAWGKCESCGVVPMLHKLYKGELIEDPTTIEDLRSQYLG
ncbi:MAG TPA: hypothetical protein PK263_00980 [bacterium]|nr:hypothetical protein [bacterium]